MKGLDKKNKSFVLLSPTFKVVLLNVVLPQNTFMYIVRGNTFMLNNGACKSTLQEYFSE